MWHDNFNKLNVLDRSMFFIITLDAKMRLYTLTPQPPFNLIYILNALHSFPRRWDKHLSYKSQWRSFIKPTGCLNPISENNLLHNVFFSRIFLNKTFNHSSILRLSRFGVLWMKLCLQSDTAYGEFVQVELWFMNTVETED